MPNLLYEVYRRASTPLVPQIQQGYDALANLVDDPNSGSSNVGAARVKGAIAGGLQGLGSLGASITSPIGAVAALAGMRAPVAAPAAAAAEDVAAAPKTLPKVTMPHEFTAVGDETPLARYAFHQDDFEGGSFPMYHIEGGPSHGSTVSAETLKQLGIPIPGANAPDPQASIIQRLLATKGRQARY